MPRGMKDTRSVRGCRNEWNKVSAWIKDRGLDEETVAPRRGTREVGRHVYRVNVQAGARKKPAGTNEGVGRIVAVRYEPRRQNNQGRRMLSRKTARIRPEGKTTRHLRGFSAAS